MTTTDTTLLIILTVLLSVFILILIATAVVAFKLVRSIQKVVAKAEGVVDSVESAAEVLKEASGKVAIVRVIKNIVDLTQRKKRKD